MERCKTSRVFLRESKDSVKRLATLREIGARWHKKQVGIAFRLCIYDERNNGKVIAKYFFYNTGTLFPKFYLNQASVTIKKKKREKFIVRGGK